MMDQKGVPPLLLNFGGQIFAILQNWQGYQVKQMTLKYKKLLHTTILVFFILNSVYLLLWKWLSDTLVEESPQ